MKTKLFFLLMLLAPMCSWAEEFTVKDETYEVLTDGTVCLVDASLVSGDYKIPLTVESPNGSLYTVTSIGEYAFCDNKRLTSVTIPNTVTKFGLWAFWGCENLKSVYISDLASWFNIHFDGGAGENPLFYASHLYVNGKEVNDLVIPDGVNSIGMQFMFFKGLHSVTIPNHVTSIGSGAFMDCPNLTTVRIGNGVTSIGPNAFADCRNLTSVISEITDPFDIDNCLLFTIDDEDKIHLSPATLYIPEGTLDKYLQIDAWSYFENIVEGTRPAIITEEGLRYKVQDDKTLMLTGVGGKILFIVNADRTKHAFTYVEGDVKIPGTVNHDGIEYTVTSIDEDAFWQTKITTVELPETITSIGIGAFALCNSLHSVFSKIRQPFELNPEWVYFMTHSDYNVNWKPSAILYVPDGTIDEYRKMGWSKEFVGIVDKDSGETFDEKESIYQVLSENTVAVMVSDVTETGYVIPETVNHDGTDYTVTAINNNAFKDNTILAEVTIPKTVEIIGDGAFAGCSNLSAIYAYATEPAHLAAVASRTRANDASSVFEGVDKENCVLYVPKGCVEKYRAAEGWGEFIQIVEMEGTGISSLPPCRSVFEVYDMNGRKVRTATTSLDGLPKGIYIVNGRKVIK